MAAVDHPDVGPTTGQRPARDAWAVPIAAAMAVAAAMTGLTAWWILRDATSTARGKAFISKPEFVLWLLVLCAQAAVWVLALFLPIQRIARRTARALPPLSGRRRWQRPLELAIATVLLALLAATLSVPPDYIKKLHPIGTLARALNRLPQGSEWPLPHYPLKVDAIEIGGFATGIAGVVAMWLVGLAFAELANEKNPAQRLTRFLGLRDDLNVLLTVIGGIIGLGTLSTGALQNALAALQHEYPYQAQIPREYVLIFGLYYSALLALAYAPAYIAMRSAGDALKEESCQLVAPNDATFLEVVAKRRTIDDLLQLNLSASASFKAGVAVLTPLAGSLVGLLIGK